MKSERHDHSQNDFEHREQHTERGYGGRRGRLFESGKMKLLVLHLIQQQPKHGYEIIKAISDLILLTITFCIFSMHISNTY